ncbi:hypothetical protein VQ042_24040 [Aurantimonas sp. A2-1-M11]|uniref:hypothetical protein n=1 Tax=Aurantimonas sp. A2-1-M11 TaxID=3113712 RepID=UPI002F94312E
MGQIKSLLRHAAIGLGALMLSGCVAETGYYSETYSGVSYEEPVYAEPVFVIDDRPRYRHRDYYRHRDWSRHHRGRWDRGYRYRDRYYRYR